MILGAFPAGSDTNISSLVSCMTPAEGEVSFYNVLSGSFSGGFFLNKRLPYVERDLLWKDETTGLTVLLSGSVYNRAELAALLQPADEVPDPELIGRLFLNEGPGFVARLNGDFAICIIKRIAGEIWLFRDHLGIRPLAYSVREKELIFSTDIVALCASLCEGNGAEADYLSGHFRYIDYRTTPCSKVRKLSPGHYLRFAEGNIKVAPYWQPEKIKTDRRLTHQEMLAGIDSLIRDAVKIRCDDRFTAGAHVSSGLDSSVVALHARRECGSQETFHGFSWSPSECEPLSAAYDEREMVLRLCRENDIKPVFSGMDPKCFREAVSSFFINHGFFAEHLTLRQAEQAGVNLIFSGWGGDEFVSTGAPSIEADLLRDLRLRLFFRRNELRRPVRFLKNVVRYIVMPALCIHERGTARAFRDDARYLRPQWRRSDRRAVKQFYFHTSRRGHHLGMLQFYHLQDRCEKWFTMGFRHGVEYRYPLLDRRIVEYMLKVPSELLCVSGYSRPLLREISSGLLPEEIRLNPSKTDPVYSRRMAELYRDAAISFMEESGGWMENPDLQFIDFGRLEEDIRRFRQGETAVADDVLFRGVIYIRAIDAFTREYRSRGSVHQVV
ncbi:MAG: asparagine synthase-related protein [Bacteroidales bacterium]